MSIRNRRGEGSAQEGEPEWENERYYSDGHGGRDSAVAYNKLFYELLDSLEGFPEPDWVPNVASFSASRRFGVADSFIYLENEDTAEDVESALREVFRDYGLSVVWEDPPERNSWFRRFGILFRRAGSSETADRLLKELDRAVELRAVDAVQAQVDAAQGDVVAKLLSALVSNPNAMVQIGSILVLKVDEVPLVRNLTQSELRFLQRNPELQKNPKMVLQHLQLAARPEAEVETREDVTRRDVEQ